MLPNRICDSDSARVDETSEWANGSRSLRFWQAGLLILGTSGLLFGAFLLGRGTAGPNAGSIPLSFSQTGTLPKGLPAEIYQASATHGTSTMAIATGPVSDDAEGVFFLDFLTGELQCWVWYPRNAAIGGKFVGNVRNQLPSGKNPEYLMVTGAAYSHPATSNTKPGASIIYVMDVNEGVFAAYAVPWTRAAENAFQPQTGTLVPVAGGQIRAPLPAKK